MALTKRYIAVNRLTGYQTSHQFWTLYGAAFWLNRKWSILGMPMGRRIDTFELHRIIKE